MSLIHPHRPDIEETLTAEQGLLAPDPTETIEDPAAAPGSFSINDVIAAPPSRSIDKKRDPFVNSWKKVGAIGATAVALAVGIFAFNHRNDAQIQENIDLQSKPARTPTTAFDPERDTTVGNVRVARVLPGDRLIVAKRPNGEEIQVPALRRSETDPNKLAESALGLMACYFTTGSQACLDSFSTDTDIQQKLAKTRTDLVSQRQGTSYPNLLQVSLFDSPDSPAKFSEKGNGDGSKTIALSGGKLYMDSWAPPFGGEDTAYQGPNTHQTNKSPYNYSFSTFQITLENNQIVGFNWDANAHSLVDK